MHFVLVKSNSIWDDADDAVDEATRDVKTALANGADAPERFAVQLRDAGYCVVEKPRMATD